MPCTCFSLLQGLNFINQHNLKFLYVQYHNRGKPHTSKLQATLKCRMLGLLDEHMDLQQSNYLSHMQLSPHAGHKCEKHIYRKTISHSWIFSQHTQSLSSWGPAQYLMNLKFCWNTLCKKPHTHTHTHTHVHVKKTIYVGSSRRVDKFIVNTSIGIYKCHRKMKHKFNKYVYIRHTLIYDICIIHIDTVVTNSWANVKYHGKFILKCTLQSVYFFRSRTNSVTMNTSKIIMSGPGTFSRVQNEVTHLRLSTEPLFIVSA